MLDARTTAMILHPTPDQLHHYHEREMPRDERVGVAEHLSRCAACHQHYVKAYGDPARALAIVVEAEAELGDSHLNFEAEIVPFVKGELGRLDRLEVELHIGWCAPCTQRVADFRTILAASGKHSSTLAPVVPALVPEGRRHQPMLASWLPLVAPPRPVQAAGFAVAVAMIVLTLVIVWWRAGGDSTPPAQQAQMESVRPIQSSDNSLLRSNPSDGRREPDTQSPAAQPSPVRPESSAVTSAPRDVTARRTTITTRSVPGERSGIARRADAGQMAVPNDQSDFVIAGSLGAEERRAVSTALAVGEIERPAVLAGIITREMTTLKGPAEEFEFRVLAPLGTVVASDRPLFRWETIEGATGYRVVIGDQNFNPVAESGQLTTNQWTPAERLPRGVVFTWQVIALVDGEEVRAPRPPMGAARFKVLESERVESLERSLSASNDSVLVRGVLYARMGLVDDARREFQQLVEANPRSVVARRLLRSVESWRAVAATGN